MKLSKIISGGQTGADRVALDWAIKHNVPHGGWCPKGRKAEDGSISPVYQLTETPSDDYLERNEWNVRDSDGTVIFTIRCELSDGSKRTADFAEQHRKPWLHLSENSEGGDAEIRLKRFIEDNNIKVLNVAGSRASQEPRLLAFVPAVLSAALFNTPFVMPEGLRDSEEREPSDTSAEHKPSRRSRSQRR